MYLISYLPAELLFEVAPLLLLLVPRALREGTDAVHAPVLQLGNALAEAELAHETLHEGRKRGRKEERKKGWWR